MSLDPFLLGFAYAAGSAAFLNPCGFALLPAYASYYIGGRSHDHGVVPGIFRGLGFGLLVTFGFIAVFGLSGLAVSWIGVRAMRYVPWLAVLVGFAIVAIGILLLRGVSITLPRVLDLKNPSGYGYASFFLFGIAYGVASLSCTVPIFLMVVFQALVAGGFLSGLLVFLSYAIGMGTMMVILSASLGASNQLIASYFKSAVPFIRRISATIIIASGSYILYFWLIANDIFIWF